MVYHPPKENCQKPKMKIKAWKWTSDLNSFLPQFQFWVFWQAAPSSSHQHPKIGHSWGLIVSLLAFLSGKCSSAGGIQDFRPDKPKIRCRCDNGQSYMLVQRFWSYIPQHNFFIFKIGIRPAVLKRDWES